MAGVAADRGVHDAESAVPAGSDVRCWRGAVADQLAAMVQAAAGKDIWIVGGGDLAGQFADIGALDEIVLTIASASLASGAPVLPRRLGSDRLTLHNVHRQGQFVELRAMSWGRCRHLRRVRQRQTRKTRTTSRANRASTSSGP